MEATTVVIRPAQPIDAKNIHDVFVAAIWGIDDCFYDQDQKQAWEDAIQAESWSTRMLEQSFVVAELSGEIIGFAAWSSDYLEHFYVKPTYGRQGVGSRLLAEVLKNFTNREIGLIASDNAFELYSRFGFVEVDRFFRPLGPVEVSCIRMSRPSVKLSI